jgi:nucleotide-binding universal stress UspA family protein
MFQRLLVCTDLCDGLQRLVTFVPSLAAGGMKQIVFLHVVPLREEVSIPKPDAQKIEQAQATLAPALHNAPSGIDVKIEVESGRAIDAILRTVKKYQSDVILMGTQSRSLLTEKLFGSTTIELSQRIAIPLLTIRPQLISTYTSEELNLRCRHLFRNLLLPYDDSAPSQYAAQQIKKMAETQPDGEVRGCQICRVINKGGRFEMSAQEEQKMIRETLEPIRDQLRAAGLRAEIEVRRGDPIAEILQSAQETDISAIVLSSKNLTPFLGSIPSFAAELLRRSWHPVLFFPPQRS